MISSLPDLEQTPTERGGAIVQGGTCPAEGLLPFFTLWLFPQICAFPLTSQSLLLYLHPILGAGTRLHRASLNSITHILS